MFLWSNTYEWLDCNWNLVFKHNFFFLFSFYQIKVWKKRKVSKNFLELKILSKLGKVCFLRKFIDIWVENHIWIWIFQQNGLIQFDFLFLFISWSSSIKAKPKYLLDWIYQEKVEIGLDHDSRYAPYEDGVRLKFKRY